jgi:hypothetical protein
VAHVVECLLCKCKALSPNPSPTSPPPKKERKTRQRRSIVNGNCWMKRPICKGYSVCDSTIWYSGNDKTVSGCQGLGRRERRTGRTQGVLGQWNHLYHTVKMNTCRYLFVKTHRTYGTKSGPYGNCGFVVIMMCQCRLINCGKCAIWWGMLIVRRLTCGGSEVSGMYIFCLILMWSNAALKK